MNTAYAKKALRIPEGATDYALEANGARASASSSSEGFDPRGAINGDLSLASWGKGNGWQAPTPVWHPNWWGEWIRVDFPSAIAIDTIIVRSFPEMIYGRFWKGLNRFHVQYLSTGGEWVALESVAGNRDECRVLGFAEVEAKAIRVHVTRMHYPEESGFEMGFTPVDESPRILEIEAYRLGGAELFQACVVRKDMEDGRVGRAAVFIDEGFGGVAPFLPQIAAAMRKAGWGVTMLDAEEVCEPGLFNASNFQLLLHPYGKYSPVGINLFDYLQGGGHLITLGGRAFTAAKQKVGGKWVDIGMDPGVTASAARYKDSLRPYREQLGIFTIPFSRLKHAVGVRASLGQRVISKMSVDGPIEGWMACGSTGELLPLDESALYASEGRLPEINHRIRQGINGGKYDEPTLWGHDENYPPLFSHPCARWMPLMEAYDRFGRDRGPVGAALMHYEGIYRGSNWAFFGVENSEFYADPGTAAAVADTANYLAGALCLHSLEPGYACYRQGEEAGFSVMIDNCSRAARTVEVLLEVMPEGEGGPLFSKSFPVELAAGEWRRFDAAWQPERFTEGMYRLRASLLCGGRPADSIENGFVVWDERMLESGPDVEFRDNYFHFNGEARYTIGARDSGLHMPGQPDENPLGWDRQYAMMRDFGMKITSPIHIDWCIPGIGWGELDGEHPVPEEVLRRMDAQVLLSQKHGLIYAPGLFFAYENQAIHSLEKSRAICESLGKRYAKAPGIIFYLADDCEMHDPDLFDRWVKTCVDALNSSGRTYMTTVEYGFRQDWPGMLRHSCRNLTFNSGSCFRQTVGDPVYDRLVDMRPAGKSFTYAEFVRRIPSGSPEDLHGYLAPPHLSFGMGYAMCMNWKWRTAWHAIWPSDVVFTGNWVPKDHLYAFRNEALFFRQFRPVYRTPELLVALPSSVWLRNNEAVTRYLIAFLGRLIAEKVDFACIDDTDLDALPGSVKAIVYPIPMEMGDTAYSGLLRFVDGGGFLLLTGDLSRVPGDKPTQASRPERLRELFGLVRRGYANADLAKGRSLSTGRYLPAWRACQEKSQLAVGTWTARPWVEVACERAEAMVCGEGGFLLLSRAPLGSGQAWFTPDVNPDIPHEVLSEFFRRAGIQRNHVTPDLPGLHCFRTDMLDGSAYTLTTFPWDGGTRDVSVGTEVGDVRLTLREQALGVIHANSGGFVDALETQGNVAVGGKALLETNAHLMMNALDGRALDCARVLVIYPISPGSLKLFNPALNRAEAGEVMLGKWRTHEKLPVEVDGSSISFDIEPLNLTNLILLYEVDGREKAIERAQESLTL